MNKFLYNYHLEGPSSTQCDAFYMGYTTKNSLYIRMNAHQSSSNNPGST